MPLGYIHIAKPLLKNNATAELLLGQFIAKGRMHEMTTEGEIVTYLLDHPDFTLADDIHTYDVVLHRGDKTYYISKLQIFLNSKYTTVREYTLGEYSHAIA